MPFTIADVVAVLDAQWDSTVPIERDGEPTEVMWGNVTYTLPDGWRVVVFVDCGEWDYIDHIVAPDGTKFDPDNVPKSDGDAIWHPVFHWSPRVEDERWGRFL